MAVASKKLKSYISLLIGHINVEVFCSGLKAEVNATEAGNTALEYDMHCKRSWGVS